jgi:hypothetical protein
MQNLTQKLTIVAGIAALLVISGASFMIWTPNGNAHHQRASLHMNLTDVQPHMTVKMNDSVTLHYRWPGMIDPDQAQSGGDEFDDELLNQGRIFFETSAGNGIGCASCHAAYALGDLGIGPFIRGVSEQTIRSAFDIVEDMDFFDLPEAEIVAIAEYLRWLGTFRPAKTLIKVRKFNPPELIVPAGEQIQFIIDNKDRRTYQFVSEEIGLEDFEIRSRRAADFTWTAPDEETTFDITCIACGEDGEDVALKVLVQIQGEE